MSVWRGILDAGEAVYFKPFSNIRLVPLRDCCAVSIYGDSTTKTSCAPRGKEYAVVLNTIEDLSELKSRCSGNLGRPTITARVV